MSIVLGVDIGGSHITAALINLDTRNLIPGSGIRRLINSQADAEKILSDWCRVINDVFKIQTGISQKIGIAMPGPFDYQQGISLISDQDKFQSLFQINVKNALASRLDIQANSIRFMNDAACFLQGEIFCGAVKKYQNVIGLTLGTGLGAAYYKGGVAHDAALWKTAFQDGIAEDYLSTRWFVNRYQQISGKSIDGVKELIEECPASYVKEIFKEFTINLGEFLMPIIKQFESQAVVFGGNISNADAYFLPSLQKMLAHNKVNVQLSKGLLNEDAALIGAASCWSVQDVKAEMNSVS